LIGNAILVKFYARYRIFRTFSKGFSTMMKSLALFLGFLGALLLTGCGTSNPVVASLGKGEITLQDFEESYAKNNGGWANGVSSTLEERQRFLELVIKFRLKVQEAKDRGLLKDSAVVEELDSYRFSVAQSYMLDKELIEPRIKEAYKRSLEEVRASHILFRVAETASPAETLAAYTKALKLVPFIPLVGFDTLAASNSEDVGTAKRGGDVGFFSGGKMVPEFEDAAYALQEGEYTKTPIRTSFGYHLIKVTKRQPTPGALRVSHILKLYSRTAPDSASVRDTVRWLEQQLRQGADFSKLAVQYSDDPATKERGGDIGFYERERLRPDVARILYSLPIDSVSAPFAQPYGFHFFKVTAQKKMPTFEESEKDIRAQYQQMRYQKDFTEYVKNLTRLFGVRISADVRYQLRSSFDSTKTPSSERWSDTLPMPLLTQALFHCAGRPFTVKEFVENFNQGTEFKNTLLTPGNIDLAIDRLVELAALKEHARKAPERHPAFLKLMDEYQDGILLYRIEQDEVWKKVVVNDSLLRIFYNTTKENYRWPERVNFAEIYVAADSARKAVDWKLAFGEDFLSVAEEYTLRTGYRDKLGIWGFQPYTQNELSQKAAVMAIDSVSDFFSYQNGWSRIKTIAKDSARVKTFEEAGAELSSAYQEVTSKKREQEWIESLKKKYGVSVRAELLGEAFRGKPREKN
jgi:peptidyl-prolyl cis-trans isomerase SurA